jgi:hypothetical protein
MDCRVLFDIIQNSETLLCYFFAQTLWTPSFGVRVRGIRKEVV